MKKIASLVCFVTLSLNADPNPISAHSFLYVHPAGFQNIALEQSLWHIPLFHKEIKSAVQVTGFYQDSFHTEKLSQFFMPLFRPVVRVNATALDRDVNPFWLQLPNTFDGYMTLTPEFHSYGVRLEARHMIKEFIPISFLENSWVFVSAPVVVVKQNLSLQQYNVQNSGPTVNPDVYDITTAFDNPLWEYSKITERPSQTALGEIRIGYGTTFYSNGRAHAATYASASIPTYKKQKFHYMFENQIGNKHHFGVLWGLSLQLPINRETDWYQVNLHADLENTFLLRNHQHRTFDLHYKQWSRFLLMRSKYEGGDVTVPGVNVLTLDVRVSPHSIIDFAAGVRVTAYDFEIDCGYGLWAFAGERIRYTKDWVETYGIAGSVPLTTSSESTIATIAANDLVFVPIKLSDIDFCSAQMPPVLVNKFYTMIGYTHRGLKHDIICGAGGFIELPHNKTKEFSLWGAQVKAGVSF